MQPRSEAEDLGLQLLEAGLHSGVSARQSLQHSCRSSLLITVLRAYASVHMHDDGCKSRHCLHSSY